MRRLQPRVRVRVQSSLLLHLRAAELERLILRYEPRHGLLQRHTLQNPGGTPPLSVALSLSHTGRTHLLVLPQLPAGQHDPDAPDVWLHAGDLTISPPQPPVLAVLHPALRLKDSLEDGEVAGRKHTRRIRTGVSDFATARQADAKVPAGCCSGAPAPGLSCLRLPDSASRSWAAAHPGTIGQLRKAASGLPHAASRLS